MDISNFNGNLLTSTKLYTTSVNAVNNDVKTVISNDITKVTDEKNGNVHINKLFWSLKELDGITEGLSPQQEKKKEKSSFNYDTHNSKQVNNCTEYLIRTCSLLTRSIDISPIEFFIIDDNKLLDRIYSSIINDSLSILKDNTMNSSTLFKGRYLVLFTYDKKYEHLRDIFMILISDIFKKLSIDFLNLSINKLLFDDNISSNKSLSLLSIELPNIFDNNFMYDIDRKILESKIKIMKNNNVDIDIPKKNHNNSYVDKYISNIMIPSNGFGKIELLLKQYLLSFNNKSNIIYTLSPVISIVLASDTSMNSNEHKISMNKSELSSKLVEKYRDGKCAANNIAKSLGIKTNILNLGLQKNIEGVKRIGKLNKTLDPLINGYSLKREEVIEYINLGIDYASQLAKQGIRSLILGDIGIGNTTNGAIIISNVLNVDPIDYIGKGAGMNDELYKSKKKYISDLKKNNIILNKGDVYDKLSRVGTLDTIFGIGLILGAAKHSIYTILDSVSSLTSFICSREICNSVTDYIFIGHKSPEPISDLLMRTINYVPILDLEFCIGEGVGSLLGYKILDTVISSLKGIGTLDEIT